MGAPAPQPATTPKKGHLLRNVGLGCGGLLLLVIIIAVATNAGKSATGSPSSSPAATGTAKVAQVLLDETGTGVKSTNKFTAGGDWDIVWSYDCTKFAGGTGNFQIYIYGKDSSDLKGVGANELGAKGNDVNHQHDTGTFFLQMNSECAWHVTVKG